MNTRSARFLLLAALTLAGVAANVVFGSVAIPLGDLLRPECRPLVIGFRLPQALTACAAGAALAGVGLLLQTLFRNPLADQSLLGISGCASLCALLASLGMGAWLWPPFYTRMGVLLAAAVGAFAALAALLWVGRRLSGIGALLIVGILLGQLAGGLIALVSVYATAEGLQQFVFWSLGDFGRITAAECPLFVGLTLAGLAAASLLVRGLNMWMQGDDYARLAGLRLGRFKVHVLAVAGALTALVTAFCGPISFIGLAAPHLSRLLFRTDDHRLLLPASCLVGSVAALFCLLLSTRPTGGILLPINALTPLIGIPVVLYILYKSHSCN